ncbi:MAG TPA: JAB domain-containing protein [Chloroflexota bacterium]|nr:JAB domain-containing protein [Chloroflexota bacterium]
MKHAADTQQISLLPPDAAELLHLVRQNLRLLAELVDRYELGLVGVAASDQVLRSPVDVAGYLGAELADLAQEQLRVVLLDTKNHVVGTQLVYQGGLNATTIRLADCFHEAIARGAAALILVHNHPSGDPTPSPEDVRLTREAGRAGDLLGIDVLDHVVIGRQGHVSLRERGLYTPASRPNG